MHNPDWLEPIWPAPPHVKAVCTTRAGGQSQPPYDALNLGDHVGDRLQDVSANRAVFQQALGVQPVFLSQVHGLQVLALDFQTPHGSEADACLTALPGLACTIMVADCLPVLFTNRQGSLVAAAHAGWRGLAGQGGYGVLEAVHERFTALAPLQPGRPESELIAWLGPCIGPQAFEVGDEVRTAFGGAGSAMAACFKPHGPGKWLANLSELARLRLAALGVTQVFGNDGSPDWCTVSQPSRFFSHRRDRVSGRLAASIWLS